MSCECSNTDNVRRFPSMLGCKQRPSYSDKTPIKRKNYLGGKQGVLKIPKTVEIVVLFLNNNDVEVFWQWYEIELHKGNLDFKINLPITGTIKEHTVRFITELSRGNIRGNTSEIKATLEVVELNDTFECKIC